MWRYLPATMMNFGGLKYKVPAERGCHSTARLDNWYFKQLSNLSGLI